MEITYLGHSSFKLKGRNASIITDPFDPSMVGLKFPKVSADIVTISHSHKDHNMKELVSDTKMTIEGPGEYEIAGVSVIGIPTFHDEEKGENRGKNIIYIFEIDDLRLVHLGDLGHKLTDETMEELGTLDVLMIPVGGIYTIGPTTASEMVRNIEPSFVIPMHYHVSGINESSFGGLAKVEDFLKEVGLTVIETDKFSVKKGEILEEEKKVVILKTK